MILQPYSGEVCEAKTYSLKRSIRAAFGRAPVWLFGTGVIALFPDTD